MALVVAIAGVAAFVRFWRLGWGLADGMCFPDEVVFWRTPLVAFVPWRWDALFPADVLYPSLFGNLAGVAIALTHALGWIDPPARAYLQAVHVARAVSALAGLATVALVGAIAARLESSRAALVAAALMAVVPLEAMQAHYLSVDVLLTACATATVWLSLRLLARPSLGRALAAGFVAGLTVAAKYSGVFVLVAPAWAAWEVARRAGVGRFLRLAVAVALAAVLGAALGCPRCAVSPDRLLAALEHHRLMTGPLSYRFAANHLVPWLGWYSKPFLYPLVATLPYALGWPLYLVALLGLVGALRRRDVGDRLLVATLLGGFLVMGQSRATFPRYALPILPLLVVLAARELARVGALVRARTAVAGAIWAYSLVLTVSQVGRFSYDQQKAIASRIAETFPALKRGGPKPRVALPLATLDYLGLFKPLARVGIDHPIVSPEPWLRDSPDAVVVSDWVAMELRRDYPRSGTTQRIELLESGAAGYREVMHVRSSYFSEPLYTALDPAFAADLWQGEIGFRLYLREDLAPPNGASSPGRTTAR